MPKFYFRVVLDAKKTGFLFLGLDKPWLSVHFLVAPSGMRMDFPNPDEGKKIPKYYRYGKGTKPCRTLVHYWNILFEIRLYIYTFK